MLWEKFMWMHLGDLKRLRNKLAIALGDGHPEVKRVEADVADCAAKLSLPVRYDCAFEVREIRRSAGQRWKKNGYPAL
jgi:hypothetical protein